MDKIMPVLKPYNYKREFAYYYKEPIFDDAASPVVAFGVDLG